MLGTPRAIPTSMQPDPTKVLVVFNASLGDAALSDAVSRELVATGKIPAEMEDLIVATRIVVNGQVRFIVEWA